jgi:hypothetical protein
LGTAVPSERFSPQLACFLRSTVGEPRNTGADGSVPRYLRTGEVLVRTGMRSISAGIAVLAMGFAVKSVGSDTGWTDAGLHFERPGISVFGTIHPEIFDLRTPVESQIPTSPGIRVASLETDVDMAEEEEAQAEPPTSTTYHASFDERFASAFDQRRGEEEESIVFGPPVWPMPLTEGARASAGTFAPAQLQANSGLPHPTNETAYPAGGRSASGSATVIRPSLQAASKKPVRTAEARSDSISLPDSDSRTAIYDIAAHTVYLPNGDRLEAHSGLGSNLDDPRYVNVRAHGPTPPNVYALVVREQPFHGVRAIRLIPVGEGQMFGRAGILAHPYMLGPNGQSNGCVSFGDYPAFLNAFLRGEVDRLVVVGHLETAPSPSTGLGWLPEALRNLFKPS